MLSASSLQRQSHVVVAVFALALLAWGFLIWLVMDMNHPLARLMMPMSADWGLATTAVVLAMWSIMMAAMMLPSSAPMVLTFAHLSRKCGSGLATAVFVGAYVLAWALFSIAATVVHWALQAVGLLSPMVASTSATLTGVLLVAAGVYQFTPSKSACLTRCRSPLQFLLNEWRKGLYGAFVMGFRHGFFCVGCCWSLMLLLFVGGVMNLPLVALIALGVAAEKLAPSGLRFDKLVGALLLFAGVWTLIGFHD